MSAPLQIDARLLQLAELVLKFGRVNRATLHPDGARWESDTDHTVMLIIIACTLAAEVDPVLDPGLIACYAAVHDLVEAECGDTNTLTITPRERAAKAHREGAAFARMCDTYGKDSWVMSTLAAYESQAAPEARFVKLVDKLLPKYTHHLNGGAAFRRSGHTVEAVENAHRAQIEDLTARFGAEFPRVLEIIDATMESAVDVYRKAIAAGDEQTPPHCIHAAIDGTSCIGPWGKCAHCGAWLRREGDVYRECVAARPPTHLIDPTGNPWCSASTGKRQEWATDPRSADPQLVTCALCLAVREALRDHPDAPKPASFLIGDRPDHASDAREAAARAERLTRRFLESPMKCPACGGVPELGGHVDGCDMLAVWMIAACAIGCTVPLAEVATTTKPNPVPPDLVIASMAMAAGGPNTLSALALLAAARTYAPAHAAAARIRAQLPTVRDLDAIRDARTGCAFVLRIEADRDLVLVAVTGGTPTASVSSPLYTEPAALRGRLCEQGREVLGQISTDNGATWHSVLGMMLPEGWHTTEHMADATVANATQPTVKLEDDGEPTDDDCGPCKAPITPWKRFDEEKPPIGKIVLIEVPGGERDMGEFAQEGDDYVFDSSTNAFKVGEAGDEVPASALLWLAIPEPGDAR